MRFHSIHALMIAEAILQAQYVLTKPDGSQLFTVGPATFYPWELALS